MPAFGAPFQAPMATPGGVPWYLAGGVAKANCIAAYQPKGAASLAASYVNRVTPGTQDAAPGVAPTFNAATGWTFNGTTQYLTTGLNPGNAWTTLIRFSGGASAAGALYGAFNSADGAGHAIYPYADGFSRVRYANRSNNTVAPGLTAGNLGVAGQKPYRNGVPESITLSVGVNPFPETIYIGCRNKDNTTAEQFYANTTIAFVVYTVTLTAAQVLAVVTAMAAL
jgi:hypothetical protein